MLKLPPVVVECIIIPQVAHAPPASPTAQLFESLTIYTPNSAQVAAHGATVFPVHVFPSKYIAAGGPTGKLVPTAHAAEELVM
jgi:hypothetical protein